MHIKSIIYSKGKKIIKLVETVEFYHKTHYCNKQIIS